MASGRSPFESVNMPIPFPDEAELQAILSSHEGMSREDAEKILKVKRSFQKDEDKLKKRRPDDERLVKNEMLK